MQDISTLSVEELKRLQREAEVLIASKKEQAIQDAYNQVIEIAAGLDLTIEQLLEYGAQKRKSPTRKTVNRVIVIKITQKKLGQVVVNNLAG